MVNPWPMLEYVPVRGAWERCQYRQLRAARKAMVRVFKQRGLFEFADLMEQLRKDSTLNGAQKRLMFEGILDDYAKFATAREAPATVPEAAPVEDTGSAAVVLPGTVSAEDGDGAREDAAASVPDVAGEDLQPILVDSGA
jgi:hypothetical protein